MSYRPRVDSKQTQVSVRLPTALRERLQKEAARRTVSLSLLIQTALEESLTNGRSRSSPD